MGRIVVLWVQITVPAVPDSGAILVKFTNIPAPIKTENYVTVSNASNVRSLYLGNDKTIRTSGILSSQAGWLGGMVVYFTND